MKMSMMYAIGMNTKACKVMGMGEKTEGMDVMVITGNGIANNYPSLYPTDLHLAPLSEGCKTATS